MTESTLNFRKSLKALDLLLEGKTAKEAMHEAEIHYSHITLLKDKFPLFLGLPRKNSRKPVE